MIGTKVVVERRRQEAATAAQQCWGDRPLKNYPKEFGAWELAHFSGKIPCISNEKEQLFLSNFLQHETKDKWPRS